MLALVLAASCGSRALTKDGGEIDGSGYEREWRRGRLTDGRRGAPGRDRRVTAPGSRGRAAEGRAVTIAVDGGAGAAALSDGSFAGRGGFIGSGSGGVSSRGGMGGGGRGGLGGTGGATGDRRHGGRRIGGIGGRGGFSDTGGSGGGVGGTGGRGGMSGVGGTSGSGGGVVGGTFGTGGGGDRRRWNHGGGWAAVEPVVVESAARPAVGGTGGSEWRGRSRRQSGTGGGVCLACRTTVLPIGARDLAYNAARNELYASVPGDADAYPNTIVGHQSVDVVGRVGDPDRFESRARWRSPTTARPCGSGSTAPTRSAR